MRHIALSVLGPALAAGVLVAGRGPSPAAEAYDPGLSGTQVKIGQTLPYSGPASSFATIGRIQGAYYRLINEKCGINGRKIAYLSVDDGYSPPKTVEQTRHLVEGEQVFGIFGSLGTPTNAAVQKYLNAHKVPQMFLFTGTSRFRDPVHYPWTIGGDLSFVSETMNFAHFIEKTRPNAKIAVLYQDDDYGKDHLNTLKATLGAKAAAMIVGEASYESTDPTVDSQILALRHSGADTLFDISLPKFAAQAIRKLYEIDWHPLHIVSYPTSSIPLVLKPAGLEKSIGLVTSQFLKEPGDPRWRSDPDVTAYVDFIKTRVPGADPDDWSNVIAYYMANAVVITLKSCGAALSRACILERVSHMDHVTVPMLLPGVTLNTTPTDYHAIKEMQIARFDGTKWVPLGGLIGE